MNPTSRKEPNHNCPEIDQLKNDKCNEIEVHETLDEVNQLNEKLLERDLKILREALLKSQNPTTYMPPQQSLHHEVNAESSGESESDQIVYFIHDEHVSRCPEV
jgi:hypothetical protein